MSEAMEVHQSDAWISLGFDTCPDFVSFLLSTAGDSSINNTFILSLIMFPAGSSTEADIIWHSPLFFLFLFVLIRRGRNN